MLCFVDHPARRCRDDQWMAEILHPCAVRTSTISSAPDELIVLPFISPWAVLVELAQAMSPCKRTCTGPLWLFMAFAKLMSAGR